MNSAECIIWHGMLGRLLMSSWWIWIWICYGLIPPYLYSGNTNLSAAHTMFVLKCVVMCLCLWLWFISPWNWIRINNYPRILFSDTFDEMISSPSSHPLQPPSISRFNHIIHSLSLFLSPSHSYWVTNFTTYTPHSLHPPLTLHFHFTHPPKPHTSTSTTHPLLTDKSRIYIYGYMVN